MPIPFLVPLVILGGAALIEALQDKPKPSSPLPASPSPPVLETPRAGLSGRYVDDGDGLHLTLSGCGAYAGGTLFLYGRARDQPFQKAAHAFFADRDGDFVRSSAIVGDQCPFYLPHGAVLGYPKPSLSVAAVIVATPPGATQPQRMTEDFLTLDAVDKPFSIVAFLRPLLVLMKSLAEADGPLVTEEVRWIREWFTGQFAPSPAELDELRNLLKTPPSLSPRQAAEIFRYRLPVLDAGPVGQWLRNLILVDGDAKREEAAMMRVALEGMGMVEADIDNLAATLGLPDQQHIDAYLAVLGLSGHPSAEELQRAWRRAMKDFHPDRYHASTLPESVKAMIARQGSEINAAYEALRRAFGYSPN